MMRRSLVSGDARAWARALDLADRGKRKLQLRAQNFLLDALATAQDSEREAAAAASELLRSRPKP